MGQTGTGKSTLLTTLILNAIEQGHGLTFFDPQRRVGEAVYECAGKAADEEFNNCVTQEEAEAWLDRYCPDHEVIVMKVQEELFREIMKYRRVI